MEEDSPKDGPHAGYCLALCICIGGIIVTAILYKAVKWFINNRRMCLEFVSSTNPDNVVEIPLGGGDGTDKNEPRYVNLITMATYESLSEIDNYHSFFKKE